MGTKKLNVPIEGINEKSQLTRLGRVVIRPYEGAQFEALPFQLPSRQYSTPLHSALKMRGRQEGVLCNMVLSTKPCVSVF